jgi:hypothetical protein
MKPGTNVRKLAGRPSEAAFSWIFRESDLAAAIDYVLNQQDNLHRFIK